MEEATKQAVLRTTLAKEKKKNCVPAGEHTVEKSYCKSVKRKREDPKFKSGEEWARAITCLPDSFIPIIRRAEEFLSERLEFKPEYFRLIMDEARAGGKMDAGPTVGVSMNDVQGDDLYKKALSDIFSLILSEGNSARKLFKTRKIENSQMFEKREVSKTSLIIPLADDNNSLI